MTGVVVGLAILVVLLLVLLGVVLVAAARDRHRRLEEAVAAAGRRIDDAVASGERDLDQVQRNLRALVKYLQGHQKLHEQIASRLVALEPKSAARPPATLPQPEPEWEGLEPGALPPMPDLKRVNVAEATRPSSATGSTATEVNQAP